VLIDDVVALAGHHLRSTLEHAVHVALALPLRLHLERRGALEISAQTLLLRAPLACRDGRTLALERLGLAESLGRTIEERQQAQDSRLVGLRERREQRIDDPLLRLVVLDACLCVESV
jgi:hypothetical protein